MRYMTLICNTYVHIYCSYVVEGLYTYIASLFPVGDEVDTMCVYSFNHVLGH